MTDTFRVGCGSRNTKIEQWIRWGHVYSISFYHPLTYSFMSILTQFYAKKDALRWSTPNNSNSIPCGISHLYIQIARWCREMFKIPDENVVCIISVFQRICNSQLKPLMCGGRINPIQQSKYHGCWCPGSLRRQVINIHHIDFVE